MNPEQQTSQLPASEPTPVTQPPQIASQRDKAMEMILPINRSGWSIAAGYVALFSLPFVFLAPIGIILGIVALVDIKKNPQRAGRGRAWFAVIYGLLSLALCGIVLFLVSLGK